MTSHETACLLNAGERAARVEITFFGADREPATPCRVTVPARQHARLDSRQAALGLVSTIAYAADRAAGSGVGAAPGLSDGA